LLSLTQVSICPVRCRRALKSSWLSCQLNRLDSSLVINRTSLGSQCIDHWLFCSMTAWSKVGLKGASECKPGKLQRTQASSQLHTFCCFENFVQLVFWFGDNPEKLLLSGICGTKDVQFLHQLAG